MTAKINDYSDIRFLESAWSQYLHYGYFNSRSKSLKDAQEALLDHLILPVIANTHSLIDLGCGTGASSRYLQDTYRTKCILVDKEISMARNASTYSRAASSYDVVCAEAQSLPLRKDYVDCVLVNEMLCHIEDKAAVFHEASRVLKQSGSLLITDVLTTKINDSSERFNALLGHTSSHISLSAYQQLLVASNFSILSIEDLTSHMLTSYECAKQKLKKEFASLSRIFDIDKLSTTLELFELALSKSLRGSIKWIAIRAELAHK